MNNKNQQNLKQSVAKALRIIFFKLTQNPHTIIQGIILKANSGAGTLIR
jgi:hypothetical protein